MSTASKIEWTDATWNPIVGCSIKSPGCINCYAMKMAHRLESMGTAPHYAGTTTMSKAGPVYNGHVAQAPEKTLLEPLRWKKPRKVFVNSMGDLFHESIPDEWIDRVFAVMALCPQHTFQVLTKRAERMRAYCARLHDRDVEIAQRAVWLGIWDDPEVAAVDTISALDLGFLPNVWLGVSAERQQEADERIPHLLQTPAAVRFISAEPLLGPIDLSNIAWSEKRTLNALTGFKGWDAGGTRLNCAALSWVIVGGESGPGARPMHPDWARSLRDQCAAAGVPFFFKQWGEWVAAEQVKPLLGFNNAGSAIATRSGRILIGGTDIPLDQSASGGETMLWKVGKRRAGRLLDGKEHNGFPR